MPGERPGREPEVAKIPHMNPGSERADLSESDLSALEARITKIPITTTLGFRSMELGRGRCRMLVPRRKEYDGIFESFHGGLLMTIADSAAAFAVLTLAGPDAKITTTDMNIRFLAAALTDVTVTAEVIKFGRTLVPVQATIDDASGRRVAIAQVTYMRLWSVAQPRSGVPMDGRST